MEIRISTTLMPVEAPDEADAPTRLAPGEKTSFRQVFEAEETPLLRFAQGLTGIRETAEDLVQEAFLRLHQHWADVQQPRAWLYRCLRNLAINHLRQRKRETPLDDDHEWEGPTPTADRDLSRMEAVGTLRLIVSELDDDDRQLLELKYREELKYDQIAARTGLSAGNVGYKLHHLLKGLADSLRRMGVESAEG